jgi:UMF1 family MFS transporter
MNDMSDLNDDRAYKKIIRSWAMYDWANSAFFTTIVAAMYPPYFHALATNAGLSDTLATAYWGYLTSATLLLVAATGPILGAISDYTGNKKRYIAIFTFAGSAITACFIIPGESDWLLAGGLYACAMACLAAAAIFYESMLPHISRPGDMDRVSSFGYAVGYVGGGLLLVVNALWVMFPQAFLMPDATFALRASFLSVAVWWGVFSIPLLKNVPDAAGASTGEGSAVRAALSRLRRTFREIRTYSELVKFLVAFWFYNSGIVSVIVLATIYGKSIGMAEGDMVIAIVLVQFIGVPASMAFARAAKSFGTKRMVLVGLTCYVFISLGGSFIQEAWHFYALAVAVGLVQGGTQALSRSLFGSMVPSKRSAEFFGFMSTSSKFAGIVGPLLFSVVSQKTGDARLGIASLVVLFVIGIVSLLRLREKEAQQVAQAEDAAAT